MRRIWRKSYSNLKCGVAWASGIICRYAIKDFITISVIRPSKSAPPRRANGTNIKLTNEVDTPTNRGLIDKRVNRGNVPPLNESLSDNPRYAECWMSDQTEHPTATEYNVTHNHGNVLIDVEFIGDFLASLH